MLLNFNNNYFYICPFAFCFFLTFSICLIRLHWNLGPLLIYRFMVTPIWALNIIFFISFIFIFYFICDSSENLVFHMVDKESNNSSAKLVANLVNENEYPLNLLVHMNTSIICGLIFLYIILNIYISKYLINKNIVKYLPQNYKIVKFFTLWLNKYLNLWSKNSNYFLGFCYFTLSYSIIMCKFILYIILLNKSVTLNDYPLVLLFYINGLILCAIIFLCIILNIYISKYLINKNIVKYLSQNSKIGRFFTLWLNKYLNLWSKNSNYFLGFCYFMLFFCITVCKIGLYLILYI
uniref:Uncharacterized protein n=1 Tax=Metarhizium rileyi (strain RCEF 4871) TaxID=1649241 RepID=A0A6H0B7M5_METRR|nr:hypothetical protein [Metarhizium rileyi]QIS49096.1 hypothetical protein [Metarhizium rileyi]